jgi:hypothetical protein
VLVTAAAAAAALVLGPAVKAAPVEEAAADAGAAVAAAHVQRALLERGAEREALSASDATDLVAMAREVEQVLRSATGVTRRFATPQAARALCELARSTGVAGDTNLCFDPFLDRANFIVAAMVAAELAAAAQAKLAADAFGPATAAIRAQAALRGRLGEAVRRLDPAARDFIVVLTGGIRPETATQTLALFQV